MLIFTLQRNMLFLILANSKGCHISSIVVNCTVVQFLFHKNTIQMVNQWSSAKNKTQKTINQGKDKERGNADAKTSIILLEHTKVILIFYTFLQYIKGIADYATVSLIPISIFFGSSSFLSSTLPKEFRQFGPSMYNFAYTGLE